MKRFLRLGYIHVRENFWKIAAHVKAVALYSGDENAWIEDAVTALYVSASGGSSACIGVSTVWRWLLARAAHHCVENRMKTHLGKPIETFVAFEGNDRKWIFFWSMFVMWCSSSLHCHVDWIYIFWKLLHNYYRIVWWYLILIGTLSAEIRRLALSVISRRSNGERNTHGSLTNSVNGESSSDVSVRFPLHVNKTFTHGSQIFFSHRLLIVRQQND